MNRFLQRRVLSRELVRRMDRLAGDLNVVLVVVAIGLATLDMTFFFTEKIIDHLPPITRIDHSADLN
jgi:hypothetical protein